LGTLCVIDRIPRQLSASQRLSMEALSRQVVRLMELRVLNRDLARTSEKLARSVEFNAASERRLRLITNSVPALIAYIDNNERFTFCNQYYKTALGFDPDTMLGRTLEEVFDAPAYAIIKPKIKAALAGEVQSFERAIVIHGEQLFQQCEYLPDYDGDGDGDIIGFYALVTDVTARRLAEKALVITERRLRDLTANIPAMVAHIDADMRYLFVNEQLAQQLGAPMNDIVGRTMQHFLPPALFEKNLPHIISALAGNTVIFDSRSSMSGSDRFYQVTYIPDRNEQESVIGFYAMVIDVTDRKRHELREAADARRLRLVTDNVPVAITYIDRERRFQFANATMYEWTNSRPEMVIGTSVSSVVGAGFYNEREHCFDRVLAGEQVTFEQSSVLAGQHRVIQSTYIPDIDPDGEIVGFYTMSSDISGMKKTEQELRRLACYDSLTGLQNRASMFEALEATLSRCRRTGNTLAVLYLDIDHFKSINDTLGHAKGDLVLAEFARRIGTTVRTTDTVARLGGDEFVIVLEAVDDEAAANAIAQKILTAVGLPWLLNGEKLQITTSIGLVVDTRHRHSSADLLKAADDCLYEAKKLGRNRCCARSL
jgi:diguanylate cyclase (GGDEF)-like protein/PAS domain S-box-containing protein